MDTPNQTRSNKKILPFVVSIIIITLAIVAGLVIYRNSLHSDKRNEHQKSIDEAAVFAAQNPLTDEERAKMVEDVKKQPAIKLSPEEAARREAEIMNSFNNQ